MTDWNHETDLLVVGSGGGGMTAALVARLNGLDVLVLEKTEYFGGSTALSGGYVWVPNNYVMAEAGITDSTDDAQTYLQHIIGDITPQVIQDTYIERSRDMLDYLKDRSRVRFQLTPGYTDYYPEAPGGTNGGRGVEPVPVNGKRLGADLQYIRPPLSGFPGGVMITSLEYRQIGMMTSTFEGKAAAMKYGLRLVYCLIAGVRHLTMGQALITRLRLSLKEAGVPLWLNTPVKELLTKDGHVVGITAEQEGKRLLIRSKKGIVLAAGGFPRNANMRQKYQSHPISVDWTSSSPGNTGDAIQMGLGLGAAVDLMDDAWWGPASLPPGEPPFFHVGERAYPGGIIVASNGKRFMNESLPYVDAIHEVYRNNSDSVSTIPSFFIMDQRFRDKYMFGTLFPRMKVPQEYYDTGYFRKADTLDELGKNCGIDPQGLVEEVRRFNESALLGTDTDFGRGRSAYDRYYGDPTVEPNPCLAPLDKPPFYAVEMYPGDIGTKGGLVTDENARVIGEDGACIEGLYAVGNCSASVMGNTYPGPGGTIGPSMTFGYIAALHAASSK